MAGRRGLALGALLLVLVASVLFVRAASESVPALSFTRTLALTLRAPGAAPELAWPAGGQAAVAVEGLGSLGSSGSDAPVPIASVAKMMTAYVTLREHPLAIGQEGFTMTVSPAQVDEQSSRVALGESTLAVRAGERLSERQALLALLLPSANNVAAMLAAHGPGGETAFLVAMNATARALGMRSTLYTDPSGFSHETVSTASDQLRLVRAAMREPVFAAIVAQRSATLPVAGTLANYDTLVGEDGYVGVKTGSDRAAGGCFAFAKRVSVAGRPQLVLGVVLGQHEGSLIDAALDSARRLGDSAAATLQLRTLLPAGARVLIAHSADGHTTSVRTTTALREVSWGGLMLPVRVRMYGGRQRVVAGERLAGVSLPHSDAAASSSAEAVAASSLGSPSPGWRLTHLL